MATLGKIAKFLHGYTRIWIFDPFSEKFNFYDLAESVYEFVKNLSLDEITIFGLHTGNKIASQLVIKLQLYQNIILLECRIV